MIFSVLIYIIGVCATKYSDGFSPIIIFSPIINLFHFFFFGVIESHIYLNLIIYLSCSYDDLSNTLRMLLKNVFFRLYRILI